MSDEKFLSEIIDADPTFMRPQTPDMERLIDVVTQMEALKRSGVSATQAYEDIVDVFTLSYLAVQRAGLNMDKIKALLAVAIDDGVPSKKLAPKLLTAMHDLAANSWAEGFAYGVTFEREGGHQPNPE